MSSEIVEKAAAFRSKGFFQKAIDIVFDNKGQLNEESLIPAFLQALYAAEEANYIDQARCIAQEISKVDPDVPTIQKYL